MSRRTKHSKAKSPSGAPKGPGKGRLAHLRRTLRTVVFGVLPPWRRGRAANDSSG
jgi:hypothetical protein